MKQLLILLFTLSIFGTLSAQSSTVLYPQSWGYDLIPSNSNYARSSVIGTIRQGTGDFAISVYRIDTNIPDTTATVSSSGRRLTCDIPSDAVPTSGSDHHLDVINTLTGQVCELFGAVRTSPTTFTVDGAQLYPISDDGITANSNIRTTASGISVINCAVTMEDVADIEAGHLLHGLCFALPPSVISTGFIAPAIGGEQAGRVSNGIPMGALFALPRDYVVPDNLNSFTRVVLQAGRDYGFMVSDGNGAANYGGLAVGTFRIEPAAEMALYGTQDNPNVNCPNLVTASSLLRCIVQQQVYNEIARVGLFRVTGGSGGVTSTPVATRTPISTAIATPTRTPVPTRTAQPTSAVIGTPLGFCGYFPPNGTTPYTVICH